MSFEKCFIVSAGTMALSTGWAAAAPVQVLDYLNLRTGPGFVYPIIEIIPAGWTIDAGGCVAGWCQVNVNGVVGYADSNFLSFGYAPVVVVPPPVVAAAPVYAPVPPPGYYYPPGPYAGYYYESDYAYGDPGYSAPFAGAYAEAGGADVRVAARRHTVVVRPDRATAPRNVATIVRRSPSANGVATRVVRPVRLGQNPE